MKLILAALVLAVVVAVLIAQRRAYVLQYLFFCRFPLALGGLLLTFPLIALGPARPFMANLLELSDVGFAVVGGVATLAALAVMFMVDLLLATVPQRFKLPFFRAGAIPHGFLAWVFRLAQGATPPLARLRTLVCVCLFAAPLMIVAAWRSPTFGGALSVGVVGAGIALLLRWLIGFGASYLYVQAQPRVGRWTDRYRLTDASATGPGHGRTFQGYLDSPDIAIHHARALLLLILFGAVYASGFWLVAPGQRLAWVVPSLALVLLLLVLVSLLLSGLAFFFDLYRVPLTLITVGGSFLMYRYANTDHYYRTLALGSAVPAPSAEGVFREWNRRHRTDSFPAMVVVAASGGGIAASRWTARVLTGLEQDSGLGARFGGAVALVSSVSGGGVGAMRFVARYADGRPPPQWELGGILCAAGTSSLEETVWGLLYPDFWRAVLPPLLRDRSLDRGWALERSWELESGPQATLAEWRRDVAAGVRPAQVFNATVTETGERFVLTPLAPAPSETVGPPSFLELYPGRDISVLTAARLSATFPFVTPLARIEPGVAPDPLAYHLADGGYYDNYGVMSAIEFLRAVLPAYARTDPVSGRRRSHVVLVQIRLAPGQHPAAATGSGWFYDAFGPEVTMLNVREQAQRTRNDLEVALLRESWAARGIAVDTVTFELPSGGPMSWHLSQLERRAIDAFWATAPAVSAARGRLRVLLQPPRTR
ncbi:MAG TPA: patatin-like phospholipase family protein [Gemmatimonadales bacterium]|nr:patatin-like phospholipase family protein [Gemmatimonadales bacterium]